MKRLNRQPLFIYLILASFIALTQSCSSDVGGNGDTTKPVVTLTSLNDGEEVISDFNITWTTNEVNKSKVDIHLSYDSGVTYNDIDTITLDIPDTGSFLWKTNDIATLNDCTTCRIRITPTDIIGNVGNPVESANDFIINNIPQVLGSALYTDIDNDGLGIGDTIRVSFDKDVDLFTTIASSMFFLPVVGDSIGSFATVLKGIEENELIITLKGPIDDDLHLHIHNTFKTDKLALTQPSGLNLFSGITQGILLSKGTRRTATPATNPIDIAPTFNDDVNALSAIDSVGTDVTAIGDVDGDGYEDLITAGIAGQVRILRNDGAGIFTDATNAELLTVNGSVKTIALGDLDNDGDLDFILGNGVHPDTPNNPPEPNRVWRNDGTGIFTDVTNGELLAAPSATDSMALGDLDDDGDLDLVTGNDGEPNRVWRNDGAGNFSDITGVAMLTLNNRTHSMALGDIDGDGDLDLVTGNGSDEQNLVWLNNGAGIFTDATSSALLAISNNASASVALGDLDSDGDLDLIASGQPSHVWRNDGAGNFTDFTNSELLAVNHLIFSITLADVDNDGDLDLVTAGALEPSRVWHNDGTGNFTDATNAAMLDVSLVTLSVTIGDLDDDGDLDLITGNLNEPNLVWLNSSILPTPGFINATIAALPAVDNFTRSIAIGDIDDDGDLDLVTGNLGPNFLWRNDGAGIFFTDDISNPALPATGNATLAVTLGDIDGDGDLDLVTGNTLEPNRVWRNDDGELFTEITNAELLAVSNDTESIALGDIDGDGDLDIVTGNLFESNRVWRNDGSGSFTDITNIELLFAFNLTYSIALGDIDNDGDLDLISGNPLEANRIWQNDGTGIFIDITNAELLATSTFTNTIALGDLDNDGDLDLVSGNLGEPNRVWQNDGTGAYTDITNAALLTVNNLTETITLADIDDDGDLDLITGNDSAPNRVWRNNGSASFTDITNTILLDVSSMTIAIVQGDVDGDGDLDLVSGNHGEPNRIWLNDY